MVGTVWRYSGLTLDICVDDNHKEVLIVIESKGNVTVGRYEGHFKEYWC